jgi:hypothetical protein
MVVRYNKKRAQSFLAFVMARSIADIETPPNPQITRRQKCMLIDLEE